MARLKKDVMLIPDNEGKSAGRSVPWLAVGVLAGLAIALVATAWFVSRLPWEEAYRARTENGIIEKLTVAFYGLTVILFVAVAIRKRWKRGFYGALVFLALALREMDFHARFTSQNLDSTRYWRSGDVPLIEKLFALAILVVIGYALVMFLKGGFQQIRADLRHRRAYAITIVGILVFLAISALVDLQLDTDIIDKAKEITGRERWALFLSLTEECIELGIPVLASLALVQWAGMQRGSEDQ